MLTEFQKIMIHTYAGGEYEHLFDDVTLDAHARSITVATGDPIFILLMDMLSSWQNCKTKQEAQLRLIEAAEDIHSVQVAISAWKDDD